MVNANTLKQWKADRKKHKMKPMKHAQKISDRPIKKGRSKSKLVAKNCYVDSTTLERVKVKVGPSSRGQAEKLYLCIVTGCGRVAISQEDISCARSQSDQIELTCANELCVKTVKLEWQKRFNECGGDGASGKTPGISAEIHAIRLQASKHTEGIRMFEKGVVATRVKRTSTQAIWERALQQLGVAKDEWYSDNVENLRKFAGWCQVTKPNGYATLKPFTALVNHCRGLGYPYLPFGMAADNSRVWARNQTIIGIRKAYENYTADEKRKGRALLGTTDVEIDPEDNELNHLVAVPEYIAERNLERAEENLQDLTSMTAPVMAVLFLMILFGIRASTLGAFKCVSGSNKDIIRISTKEGLVTFSSSKDVWFSAEGLCYTIRFVKYWTGDRQGSRTLPLSRKGSSCVPWGPAGHPRTRMMIIIQKVLEQGRFWFLTPNKHTNTHHDFSEWMDKVDCDNGIDAIITSHTGRRTMANVCLTNGAPESAVMEWGLWKGPSAMRGYRESHFSYGEFYTAVFDWMCLKKG